MRLEIIPLTVPANGVTGPGPARSVKNFGTKTLQVVGGNGSYDVEVSLNGTDFVKIGTTITNAGFYHFDEQCTHIRINATSNTTAPTILLAGSNND